MSPLTTRSHPHGSSARPSGSRGRPARALFDGHIGRFTREACDSQRPGRCRVIEDGIDEDYFARRLDDFETFLCGVGERGAKTSGWACPSGLNDSHRPVAVGQLGVPPEERELGVTESLPLRFGVTRAVADKLFDASGIERPQLLVEALFPRCVEGWKLALEVPHWITLPASPCPSQEVPRRAVPIRGTRTLRRAATRRPGKKHPRPMASPTPQCRERVPARHVPGTMCGAEDLHGHRLEPGDAG